MSDQHIVDIDTFRNHGRIVFVSVDFAVDIINIRCDFLESVLGVVGIADTVLGYDLGALS